MKVTNQQQSKINRYFKNYIKKIKNIIKKHPDICLNGTINYEMFGFQMLCNYISYFYEKMNILKTYPHYSNFEYSSCNYLRNKIISNNNLVNDIVIFFTQECTYEYFIYIKNLLSNKISSNTSLINYFCKTLNIIDRKIFNNLTSNEMQIYSNTLKYLLTYAINKLLCNIYTMWHNKYTLFDKTDMYRLFVDIFKKIILDYLPIESYNYNKHIPIIFDDVTNPKQNELDVNYKLSDLNKLEVKHRLWISDVFVNGTNDNSDIFIGYNKLNNFLVKYLIYLKKNEWNIPFIL